tara:strand:- start:493 stop:903 length:411 start_codon:yes stop_codon:yes gene_type:complete
MTIKEAAELVLQVINLSKGGDVFLLDMGEPVLIRDLAKQLVNLSGLEIKDEKNPLGDIEIIYTGLRPGEKLYEELLINGESQKTIHPLIFRASEEYNQPENLWLDLKEIEEKLLDHNLDDSLSLLKKFVPEWVSKI